MSHRSVAILNPIRGGNGLTSLKNARHYVAKGRARWEGGSIRFIDELPSQPRMAASLAKVHNAAVPVPARLCQGPRLQVIQIASVKFSDNPEMQDYLLKSAMDPSYLLPVLSNIGYSLRMLSKPAKVIHAPVQK